jgi:enoyl-CoA hydratase/carnithine racemase
VPGVRIERKDGLAVLRMDKSRGNAIDEPFAAEIGEAARALAADASVTGVLLASAHPKLFSPGLDLTTLLDYDRPALERFMLLFADTLKALYALPKPMVAAVSGHAVAGGAILAMTADYRVLRRGGVQIGLNEVRVGVPLPWSVTVLLRATVPPHALSQIALLGRNFADDEATGIGLVDQLADADLFEDFCVARLQEFAEKDAGSLAKTKTYLREGVLREMRAHERERLPEWLDSWFSAGTQARIRSTVASLSRKG